VELNEANQNSVILVDFQPAYQTEDFGYDAAIESAIQYLNKKRPSATLFYNGQDVGIEDTPEEVFWHYVEHGLDEDMQGNLQFKEKSYAWLRNFMDTGVDDRITIRVIRYLVMNDMNDSRDIDDAVFAELVGDDWEEMDRENTIYMPEISIGNLKSLSGSLLGGGGKHECLKEIQLLMNAFNIRFKTVQSWIYGG